MGACTVAAPAHPERIRRRRRAAACRGAMAWHARAAFPGWRRRAPRTRRRRRTRRTPARLRQRAGAGARGVVGRQRRRVDTPRHTPPPPTVRAPRWHLPRGAAGQRCGRRPVRRLARDRQAARPPSTVAQEERIARAVAPPRGRDGAAGGRRHRRDRAGGAQNPRRQGAVLQRTRPPVRGTSCSRIARKATAGARIRGARAGCRPGAARRSPGTTGSGRASPQGGGGVRGRNGWTCHERRAHPARREAVSDHWTPARDERSATHRDLRMARSDTAAPITPREPSCTARRVLNRTSRATPGCQAAVRRPPPPTGQAALAPDDGVT